jgi:hydroxycarboxylate dehydrogenase B
VPRFHYEQLAEIGVTIFAAYGVPEDQARIVSEALARANLVGHDSHGVIRIAQYIEWLERGDLCPDAEIRVVKDAGPLLAVEGNHGFGQVIGRWAMELAIAKAREHGFALMALSHCGHLGRIGDYPGMAVSAGFLSLHFVNTHGGGKIVAPYGGSDRRMSANPFAAGVPVPGGTPIIIDISTSAIAGGKVHVAYNKGTKVPEGCLVDRQGRPTTDPTDFMQGLGALLSFGGHKGYAIGLLCDILAGALCNASCSHPAIDRVANAMFTVILNPACFCEVAAFHQEVRRYLEYLKESPLRPGFTDIAYPGEPEARADRERSDQGIELDAATWREIVAAAAKCGVNLNRFHCDNL